jgi:Family of unknown function (DUF6062)
MAATLPVRDLLDSRLVEILAEPGCPVCAYRNRSARRFIEAVLSESVNDRGFRRDLDTARGFCREHTHEVLAADRRASGGSVAAAILFGAVAAVRGGELDTAAAQRGRARENRLQAARRAPDCPVCREARVAEGHAIARLVDRSADDVWADALARAEICLDHLLAFGSAASGVASWRAVEDRQRARIAELRERLRLFVHHSSHDRRHLITDEERRSADEAARLLGGTPPEN